MKNSKKTIYFVRHGQTAGNVAGQTLSSDAPLNELGQKQAQFVASRASHLDFGCIISSDYCRAKQTAKTIQDTTGKSLEFSELFREYRRPSEFWGRMSQEDPEVLAGYKAIEDNFFDEDWYYSDEENFFDLRRRGQVALQFLLDHQEDKILVVSHANFLRNLLGLMLRGDRYSPQDYLDIETTFSLNNTSVTIAYQKYYWRREVTTWTLSSWNDDAHLGSIT